MTTSLEITGQFIENRFVFAPTNPLDPPAIIADIHCNGRGSNPADCNGKIAVKGSAFPDDFTKGLDYRFYGHFTNYFNKRTKKNERQFKFNSFVRLEPVSREAVIGYLINHGAGLGLGRQRAVKLWELFGEDCLTIARTDHRRVSEALTAAGLFFRPGNALMLANSLNEDHATEQIKLDLTGLLNGRGFPKSLINTLIQTWGNKAASMVRRDPFKLLRFAGCGFKKCDAMYLDLGLNPSRLKRQALCAWYAIDRDTDGHTWYGWKVIDAFLRANIAGAEVKVERAIELATRGELLAVVHADANGAIKDGGEVRWFAEWSKAENERTICERVMG
jgi:hypothetical protein